MSIAPVAPRKNTNMIIDCHTHLGRNHHIEATAKNLVLSMDEAKIDKSLVFAGMLNDAPNEWMLDQIAPYKDRLIGVAAAHPQLRLLEKNKPHLSIYSDERQLALRNDREEIEKITNWYNEGLIKAVKFYTGYDHYYPSDQDLYLNVLNELGCPAIFHSGDCLNTACHSKLKYALPLHIDDVAVDYPKMNFIIAHMGYPWHRDAAEVCYKNANVYADISGFVYGDFSPDDRLKFGKTIREFNDIASSEKLLFGTDSPISNQKSYVDVLQDTIYPPYRPEQLSDNAKKVFKL